MSISKKTFAMRAIFALLILTFSAAPATSMAQNEKPYSAGPVEGSDFLKVPPDPRPVEDGFVLKAEIQCAISVDRHVNTTYKTNQDGTITITTKTTSTPKAAAAMDKDGSWIDPAFKNDAKLLDHEQGHMDITEKNARELQAELNKKQAQGEFSETKTLPAGTSQEDIDKEMDKMEANVIKKVDDLYNAKFNKNVAENDEYDKYTGHGTDDDKQAEARQTQKASLEKPNTDDAGKKGASAISKSGSSIDFDSALKRLSIDDDIIIGFDPLDSDFIEDPDDPMLRAELFMPYFSLVGQRMDGSFFFTASGDAPSLDIVAASGDMLFSTGFAYLIYDPYLNLFFGLGDIFEIPDDDSEYLNHMEMELTTGDSALFGIEISPDIDFAFASNYFTSMASASFANDIGARRLPTPEPATLLLIGSGLFVLGVFRRKRAA